MTRMPFPALASVQLKLVVPGTALDRNHAHERIELIALLRRNARSCGKRRSAVLRPLAKPVELKRAAERAQSSRTCEPRVLDTQLIISKRRDLGVRRSRA